MLFAGKGGKIGPGFAKFPGAGATKSQGFSKAVPVTGVATSPYFGGGFGKGKYPFGFGKGKYPFGFGKGKYPFGFGKFGKPTLAGGYSSVVPTTTVATTPSLGGFGKGGFGKGKFGI